MLRPPNVATPPASLVCVTSVFLTFVLSLNAAFFFARYRMPGHRFFWYFFLILMLMPGIANLVPLFMLLKNLNLLNTFWALMVVYTTGGQVVQIYILRNFIEDIPKELFESTQIDGGGHFAQIRHIVLPLSASIISVTCIMDFLASWNNVILPLLLIRDDALLTIPVGLFRLDGEYVKQYGQLMAGYAISSIPLLVIFLFSMKFFVRGLAAGAIKG